MLCITLVPLLSFCFSSVVFVHKFGFTFRIVRSTYTLSAKLYMPPHIPSFTQKMGRYFNAVVVMLTRLVIFYYLYYYSLSLPIYLYNKGRL